MKVALVSQRVDVLPDRGERRDAIDQRFLDWVASCGFLPIPVPNRPERVASLWMHVQPCAIVLSGGNDLAAYGGDAAERDETERALVTQALTANVPLLGVCRGAQMLLAALGHELQPTPGHIGVRHQLQLDDCHRTVNSYHSWGCRTRNTPLRVLARAEDDTIEAFCHPDIPILGMMWHPEREPAFHPHDRALVERYLTKGSG